MTTYCVYDGLSLLDIMVEHHSQNSVSFNMKNDIIDVMEVEHHSQNSVSFNLKVDEDMQQSRD